MPERGPGTSTAAADDRSDAAWLAFMDMVHTKVSKEWALRSEVKENRVKKHYKEIYQYENSLTPDAVDVARRATTEMLLMQW